MTQPIARIYASQTNATSAQAALQEAGFRAESITLMAGPETDGEATTMLSVIPPFGGARLAGEIMDGFSPTAVATPDMPATAPEPAMVGFTFNTASATPLSDAFGWKVLLNDPTPLSTYMGWKVLRQETGPSRTLDSIRKQSANPTPFSSMLGLRVLIDNPTPLSSKLGWKTLWGSAAPLSEKFGWKTLWGSAAPLSEKLGWPLLINNPTPLSSLLGWPVLSK